MDPNDSTPVQRLVGGLVGLVLFVLLIDAAFCGCLVFDGTIVDALT